MIRLKRGDSDWTRLTGGSRNENLRASMTQEAGSVARQWMEHHAKCEVAKRDHNRFMDGR